MPIALRAKIYYKNSTTGRDLVDASNGFLSRCGKLYKARLQDIIFNWGRTYMPVNGTPLLIFNKPNNINNSVNKIKTFELLENASLRHVPATNNPMIVVDWLNNGFSVMGRKIINGHGGVGIIVYKDINQFRTSNERCELYTKYIKPKYECRIHVAFNEVIDMAIKKRSSQVEEHNEMIRSHNGGWVFVRSDIDIPTNVTDLAKESVKAIGLDFGAVDIVVSKINKPYVLEINSAPGLSPSGVEAYLNAFENKINTIHQDILEGRY